MAKWFMLPPHIAEWTRLDSTTNDSRNHSWANVPVHTLRSHRSLVIRVRGGEEGRCTSCCRGVLLYYMWLNGARCVVGSLVFRRVGTGASFDAEQKNRHQRHRHSHSARMPNIRRARSRTLSTHPDSRSRGECSAMCGGSIRFRDVLGACTLGSWVLISLGTRLFSEFTHVIFCLVVVVALLRSDSSAKMSTASVKVNWGGDDQWTQYCKYY
jgi:hypothetical protein